VHVAWRGCCAHDDFITGSERRIAIMVAPPGQREERSMPHRERAGDGAGKGPGGKRSTPKKAAAGGRRWSQQVTAHSDALDLREGVFALDDPEAIARSLKRSAERSERRKSEPFRSAMSMLTFYINRAGDQLPQRRRRRLEQAKDELRVLFGRERRH
jgi:hypothetical protein